MTKTPKAGAIPQPTKRAKDVKIPFPEKFIRDANSIVLKKEAISHPIKSRMGMQMIWSDERKDIKEVWSWGERRDWTGELWDKTLFPFLEECKKKTWSEIERENAGGDKRHKAYDIDAICEE